MTRVLIVSSRASERRYLATLLGYSRYQVSEAADGPEALALAREQHPDLVVTEDLLPTLDACELLRRLREEPALAQTPAVLCTAAYREREARALAEACGGGFLLTRPFAPGAILRTVQSALGVPLVPAPGAPAAPYRSQFEQLGDALARYTSALETVSLRLAALVQLGLELASERDPARLLQSFCDAAREIVGARYAAIGMLDADGLSLGAFLTSGIDAEAAARIGAPPAGRGVLGLLFSERQPLRLRDIARHPASSGFPPHHPPMRSFLGVPVASPAQLHGRLYVTEKLGAEEFDEEDERLLLALAAQVAVAYENALQHQELARRAEALEREVAERRQAQEQLRLLDAALEAAANAIVVTDLRGHVVWANPAFAGLTGYTLDECRGRNMRILKSGRHEDAFYAELWRTILSGQVWQRETVNQRKDGTLYVEDQTITPVYCQRHVITHFIAVKIDVTEKRRAEQALKESEERYRTLAEAAQDDIFILDPEHRMRYVNACGARRLRRMPAEVVGSRLEELFPPEVAARLCASADEVFATGRPVSQEEQAAFPWGQVWLSTSLVALPGPGGEVEAVMGISRDITERKRHEELRRRAEEMEEQNRRSQEASRLKSEFLANMSHELRTPLNAILGFAQLMHDGKVGPVSDQHKDYLADILTSGRHLLQLVNDVLDLAKVESGKMEFQPELVDLPKLVSEVRDILKTLAAEKRVFVETAIDPALTGIVLDPRRLKQVLYNYVSNALKFTPESGTVTVRVGTEGPGTVRLEVEDTGVGIRPEDLGRLFVEFQQLDSGAAKRQPGTGLGLALTRRIVEAQGGHVGVRSTPGQGSVFFAILPRGPQGAAGESAEIAAHPRTAAPLVLVIEDDAKDWAWLEATLSGAGYAVESARTGGEALARCRERAFEAIVLDILLPDMSGWDALRAIRAAGLNRDTPTIVVTVVAEKGAGAGFFIHDCLTKPIRAKELLASLERAGVLPGVTLPILVVEDDPADRRLMEALLRQLGYRPLVRPDGASGLQAAVEDPPAAVVLDLVMPGIDGFEFLERFRRTGIGRRTPVIVWTAHDLTAEVLSRLRASAQAVVQKSSGAEALLEELRAHVVPPPPVRG